MNARQRVALVLGAVLAIAVAPLAGQEPAGPASPQACVAILGDGERLACFDRALAAVPGTSASDTVAAPTAAAKSLLDSRWELFPASKLGSFGLRAYQPAYVLPWMGSLEVNQFPSSPAPGHTVSASERLDSSEVKFQISWKTKVWQGVFGDAGDLWLAYTQSSRWQLFNSARSRPFRETNYEPEVLLVFATHYRLAGWNGRLFAVGLNHESNGRNIPHSRGWNRVTASVGLERDAWTFTVRPWLRLPDIDSEIDNPDIGDYKGRADLLLVRHTRQHEVAVLLRHSLRGGGRSRGAAQVDWAFPIRGNLRAHVQLFHGYGESLIDYNFRSTRIGLGISLIEWY